MKKRLTPILLAFIVSMLTIGCEALDKCDGYMCSTGPPQFSVVLVDKVTGENVFASGRFNESEIKVTDIEGNAVYSTVVGEGDYFVIRIALPSREGDITVNLNLGDRVSIPISAYVREGKTKCCTNYFAEDVTPTSYKFEKDEKTGDFIIEI